MHNCMLYWSVYLTALLDHILNILNKAYRSTPENPPLRDECKFYVVLCYCF